METIIGYLHALQDDMPQLIITDEIIKQYILDNMEDLIEEIREEM